ncbi:MAG: hypothetical protein CML16_14875 [Pusillimonas sp.]|nr:hypothetical protein [Pusillimonas sp.]MBC42814.1 hypothetical protein [Pusillimonas sp.]HCP78620.1 hypothetical protein [Pusillimonas sp.]|tara:strand:+ start:13923 stop:14177 length:255 start_codon:yes stop_codon:yes gene_type:complete
MIFDIERQPLSACPDDCARVAPTHQNDRPDLCRELVWHGLALAVRNERPFMGKSHEWWQNMILDTVYEKCEPFVDIETLRDYEA